MTRLALTLALLLAPAMGWAQQPIIGPAIVSARVECPADYPTHCGADTTGATVTILPPFEGSTPANIWCWIFVTPKIELIHTLGWCDKETIDTALKLPSQKFPP